MRCGSQLTLVCVLSAALGCSPRQAKISYPLDDVPRLSGGPLSQLTLVVEPLRDGRDEAARARPAVVQQGGGDWDANADETYGDESVSVGVTNALAEHLRAAELFRSVQTGNPTTPADLHLAATLRRFDALRDHQPVTRGLYQLGGLVPVIVATNTDSRYDADVVIEEIRLYRPATGAVLWQGEVDGAVKGTTTIAASGNVEVRQYANVALKQAIDKLLDHLARLRAADVTASTSTADVGGKAQ